MTGLHGARQRDGKFPHPTACLNRMKGRHFRWRRWRRRTCGGRGGVHGRAWRGDRASACPSPPECNLSSSQPRTPAPDGPCAGLSSPALEGFLCLRFPLHAPWRLLPHNQQAVDRLARTLPTSPLVAQLLLNRGLSDADAGPRGSSTRRSTACTRRNCCRASREAADRIFAARRARASASASTATTTWTASPAPPSCCMSFTLLGARRRPLRPAPPRGGLRPQRRRPAADRRDGVGWSSPSIAASPAWTRPRRRNGWAWN